jgi:hypothetical protein
MSPALFEFYDNCKKHFHLEFMTLLKALISNVDTSKKLEENCKAGHLLNFYKLELSSKLKFGQHPICQDAATECNARLKQLIQDFGMKLQIETQVARFLTANELRNKLKACGEDFLEFGKQEWMKQCKKHHVLTFWTSILQSKASSLKHPNQHLMMRRSPLNSEKHHGPTPIKPDSSYSRCPPISSLWPSTTAGEWSTKTSEIVELKSLQRTKRRQERKPYNAKWIFEQTQSSLQMQLRL